MKIHYFQRLIALLLCALALSSCGYKLRATPIEPPEAAPAINLTDQNGQRFQLAEQRDKLVLLFFGYTNCPDICLTTLADLAAVRRRLGSDAKSVLVTMVTVDPARDTTEALRSYMTKFDSTFVGLTGTPAELDPVYKAYGVTAIVPDENSQSHQVDHSGYIYVIDKQGRWSALMSQTATIDDITDDVRYLVRGW